MLKKIQLAANDSEHFTNSVRFNGAFEHVSTSYDKEQPLNLKFIYTDVHKTLSPCIA